MKLRKVNRFTAGDRKLDEKEQIISDIQFKIHKFTPRRRPSDRRNVAIFPSFSEFGCETIAVVYCLPKLIQQHHKGKYTIVVGWHGREYFYRHLVDEFWELPEEHMWLREYCRAFHHVSRNLKRLEKNLGSTGVVVGQEHLGNAAVFPVMEYCPCGGSIIRESLQKCSKCNRIFPEPGLFTNVEESKKTARWLPMPSKQKIEEVKKILPPRAVGITGRKRKTYGRNLGSIFYERLIYLIEDLGYSPVWLGEKSTSLSCPFARIVDLSGLRDLETTLAAVSQMEFTVQFWTASTRLAALMGVPYLLFESPDQIWGVGQEGLRLDLVTRGNRKLVISHYKNVCEDNTTALNLVKHAIREMQVGDFEDLIGLVESRDYVKFMRETNARYRDGS